MMPKRLLLGPGPSSVALHAIQAMAMPPIGHLDPAFSKIMNQTKAMFQAAFQTRKPVTYPVAGLGQSSGKVWRIGLMGGGTTLGNVETLPGALEDTLVSVS